MRRRLRAPLFAAAVATALGLLAAPAGAHVEPEVSVVPAGSTADVEFTVEHGCDGSPTTKLEFQVPDGIADAQPVEKEGWSGAVVDGVVTYTGGSLPDDEEGDFGIRFTVPDAVGTTIRFPMIQTCEEGSLEWIQDGEDAERPAPSVEVGEPDPNATTAPTTPTTATAETTTTAVAEDPSGSTTSSTRPPTGGMTREDDEDDGSSATVPALVAAVVVVLAGGGFLTWRMRRDQSTPS